MRHLAQENARAFWRRDRNPACMPERTKGFWGA